MKRLREIWDEHRYGILCTISFYLIVAIILMSIKINRIQSILELELEYMPLTEEEIAEQLLAEAEREALRKKSSDEEVEKMLRSITVNENADREKSSSDADLERYIEETISQIDGHKGHDLYKATRDENFSEDSLRNLRDKLEDELDALESTFYAEGGSVTYSLGNRYKRYLPIPIFKCENGGEITVNIGVNQKGKVVRATISEENSDPDPQLRETAVDAALRSTFNEKGDGPEIETGTITYHFVKQ